MTPAESDAWRWVAEAAGWVAAIFASFVAWAVRETFLNRLDKFESRLQGMDERIRAIEALAVSAVTHTELTSSVLGLRDEIRATRLEIKDDVKQILAALRVGSDHE